MRWLRIPKFSIDFQVMSSRVCRHFEVVFHYFCHFEGSEKSKIGDCRMCNDLRFFTPLRFVQNDRDEGAAFEMTGDEDVSFRMTG